MFKELVRLLKIILLLLLETVLGVLGVAIALLYYPLDVMTQLTYKLSKKLVFLSWDVTQLRTCAPSLQRKGLK